MCVYTHIYRYMYTLIVSGSELAFRNRPHSTSWSQQVMSSKGSISDQLSDWIKTWLPKKKNRLDLIGYNWMCWRCMSQIQKNLRFLSLGSTNPACNSGSKSLKAHVTTWDHLKKNGFLLVISEVFRVPIARVFKVTASASLKSMQPFFHSRSNVSRRCS